MHSEPRLTPSDLNIEVNRSSDTVIHSSLFHRMHHVPSDTVRFNTMDKDGPGTAVHTHTHTHQQTLLFTPYCTQFEHLNSVPPNDQTRFLGL